MRQSLVECVIFIALQVNAPLTSTLTLRSRILLEKLIVTHFFIKHNRRRVYSKYHTTDPPLQKRHKVPLYRILTGNSIENPLISAV
jgi:hypothetical protein